MSSINMTHPDKEVAYYIEDRDSLWVKAYKFRDDIGCTLPEWRGIMEFLTYLDEEDEPS
jgi:hypothetical protein